MATDNYVTVSVEELVEYYKQHNISDYPKTKYGLPKMNSKINRNTIKLLITEKKQNNEINNDNTCSICAEILTDNCTLKCKHTFCVSCMISHFRINNSCPLCRHIVCDKPKKMERMPDEMIQQNIQSILMNEQEVVRQNMNMSDYLFNKLEYYKQNYILNRERYI
jgi:hypothetical protein